MRDAGRSTWQAEMAEMVSIGAKWLRLDVQWLGGAVTNTNGASQQMLLDAKAAGMDVLVLLNSATRGWATSGYATWCGDIVEVLAPLGFHYFEVLNEVNLAANWQDGIAKPDVYTSMLQTAYTNIKAADPDAFVTHCGLAPYGQPTGAVQSGNWNPFDWLQQMYNNGGGGYFDAANFHPYTYPDQVDDANAYNTFTSLATVARPKMMANGDGAKPIWITEYGVPTGISGGYTAYPQAFQAECITTAHDLSATAFPDFMGPLMLYSWVDSSGADGEFGVKLVGGTQKQSYAAFQNAAVVNPDLLTAPRPVRSNNASIAGGVGTLSCSLGGTATAGNLLVWAAGMDKQPGTLTMTGTGWSTPVNLRSTSTSLAVAWKVADGTENTLTGTVDGTAPPAGSRVWVGEFAQTGTGAWTVLSAISNTDESSVTTKTTGTTAAIGVPRALGLAFWSIDSVSGSGSSYNYSNGYGGLLDRLSGVTGTADSGAGGLWVAARPHLAGATAGSTITCNGATGDQMSGAIIAFGRA